MSDEQAVETWQANGRVVIKKFDRTGDLASVMINRGKKFTITEQERVINQDRAASSDLDVFQNGMLSPVRLIDGSEAEKVYASNPNTMSEDAMLKLFKAHWKTFESKVADINSPFIIAKMIEMAENEDVNATVRQMTLLERRRDEISPLGYIERRSEALSP